jgi:hypothetical protein
MCSVHMHRSLQRLACATAKEPRRGNEVICAPTFLVQGIFQGAGWSILLAGAAPEGVGVGGVDRPEPDEAVHRQLRERASLPGRLHLPQGLREEPRWEVRGGCERVADIVQQI